MKTKSRTLRLTLSEEKMIRDFLEANPFLDFSTLARMAITQFLRNPGPTFSTVSSDKTQTRSTQRGQNGK